MVPAKPESAADKAIQAVVDGPPEYIPAKFWDAEKKQARVEDLGRSYLNLEKLNSRTDRIAVPASEDDAEGWQRWYVAGGRPEKIDDYQFERPQLPDGMQYDEDGEKFYRQWAFENGLNKRQAKSFYDNFAKLQVERHSGWLEMQKQAKAEAQNRIQTEFGQGYDAALTNAKTVLRQYGDPEFLTHLDETGLGNDPRLVRIFARIGKDMNGSTQLKGSPAGQAQPADIQKAIADFREKNHKALYDHTHPDNARLVREMEDLYRKLYPEIA
jgi:hypothetical protein